MSSRIGPALAIMTLLIAAAAGAVTGTNNNGSCDIGTAPAATLLLPYFEVDFNSPMRTAQTTLFTIVNTSHAPQIARVTLWTDLGYPMLDFNLFLTGYDVQSINLYDLFGPAGMIPGTSPNTPPGERSLPNSGNPHFAHDATRLCSTNPGPLSADVLRDIRSAFTTGRIVSCGSFPISFVHTNAIGYATIDVVRICDDIFPTNPSYYAELLDDNVLTGDYEQILPNPVLGNYATGNPLVHIRAVDDLPKTFYERYTPILTPAIDRRQPLPSVFAARFVQGGLGGFNTNFKIWREVASDSRSCSDYAKNGHAGTAAEITETVRFDEHENPTVLNSFCPRILCQVTTVVLPDTSSTASSSGLYPPLSSSGDVGGWMYFNLNNNSSTARATQNWVTVSMAAEGRYAVEFDAAPLANGCSPLRTRGATIGP